MAGVLTSDVDAEASVRSAGPASYDADTRAMCQLTVRLGHHRCSALLTACKKTNFLTIVKRIKYGQVALTGHTEYVLHPVRTKLID